jgi:hypothetical protein
MSLTESNKDSNPELIDIIIDSEKKTLLELLVSEEIKAKIDIKLNNNEVDVITNILKYSPEFLNDIEKAITEIIKDSRIDANDIPNFIIIIQKIYELIHNAKKFKYDSKKIADVCGNILKFIIHIMVEERKIKIDDDKKIVFLELTDKLIDSCINLLILPKLLKGTNCLRKLMCI